MFDHPDREAAFEHACDPIMIIGGEDGRLLDTNTAMLAAFGYSRDAALELRLRDLVIGPDADSQGACERHLRQALRGESRIIECRAKRSDGTLFWVELTLARIDLDGAESLVVLVRDIDARKRKEEDQGTRLDHLDYILEGARVGTWEWNVQTGQTAFNEIWAEMIGRNLDEIMPMSFETRFELIHPEDLKRSEAALAEHFRGETEYYETEFRMRHRDGRWIWILNRGKVISRTPEGDPLWMYGTHQDISERKAQEESLLREEKKYATILRAAVDGFWLSDQEGRLLEVNESYCRMSGYSERELLSMRIPQLEGAMSAEEVADRIAEVRREGFARFETRHRHKDGHLYDVDVSAQSVEIDQMRVVIFLRDISERKAAERERKSLQEQLIQSRKMEAVGRLAGGVAHDFNNMLNVILGYGELALERTAPDQPLHSDLRDIVKAARRSADITRQLLAFARQQTAAPQVLDLNEIVTNMLKMIQRLIGEDIRLTWMPGRDLRPIRVDPSQIDQILVNLCVNARDAIGGVGRLTIETAVASIDEAHCRRHLSHMPGEWAVLSVTDDGCGMDKETRQNIFEPFFTTKGLDQGTGLGLATVYGIVKQNAGFIDVDSEPGRGTTFRIYFPLYEATYEPRRERAAASPDMRGDETILLVEDEAMILNMARLMLQSLGYTVLVADTPRRALRLVRETEVPIHLLITDVVMPEMNGLELVEELQALAPEIRHLFMSGYTANVIARHGVLDEGAHFISKPFSKRELSAKVREVLDESRLPARTTHIRLPGV